MIIPKMTNHDYHANPAIGASGLKLIDRSPAHYYARYLDPNRPESEPTAAMMMGTATHMAALEPDDFARQYYVLPADHDGRTKAGKELVAYIESTGKTALKNDHWQQIAGMVAAVRVHPFFRKIDGRFQAEASIFWNDVETGVQCKCRPDIMISPCAEFPAGIVADLKTTTDARIDAFGRQAWDLDMLLQAAWYSDGFASAHDGAIPEFYWIAVEKEAPYAVSVYRATERLLEYGRRECRRLLDVYAECLASGAWPAYSETVADLMLPAWADNVISADTNEEVMEIFYAE